MEMEEEEEKEEELGYGVIPKLNELGCMEHEHRIVFVFIMCATF